MTNAEAWFNQSLRLRKPEGSLGRTAQDGHLDSHTAPELSDSKERFFYIYNIYTQSANFRGNPLRQATKRHLNNS